MHRVRASLSVVVLVAASLLLSGPAEAGGPTSALLSVPGQGKTASLYYTDPAYDSLADLVGISGETGTGKVDSSGASHATGPGVTVTWLIHDVMPWRVDHVYLAGQGAPWIATQLADESGAIWDSEVVWHQPTSPSELAALLDKLGVGSASLAAGDFTGVAGADQPEPAEPATSSETTPQPAAAEASSWAGIWWGLGGLAAGVLLTVLWVRRTRADVVSSSEPRDDDADAPELLGAEELSWPAPRG